MHSTPLRRPAAAAGLLLLLFTAACGFHLRGAQVAEDLGGRRIFVDAGRSIDLAAEIRTQLAGSGARLQDGAVGADYVIHLLNEQDRSDVLSVSPQTGKAEEYRLGFSVNVSVTGAGGETLVMDESVSVSRDYTFDEEAVLSKFSEQEVLRMEMRRDAAARIIRRFAAAVRAR